VQRCFGIAIYYSPKLTPLLAYGSMVSAKNSATAHGVVRMVARKGLVTGFIQKYQ
jgi:hypothetical protein